MSDHRILVPLDGSVLAECVLPHVVALQRVLNSEIVLLRVIPSTGNGQEGHVIDPFSWEMEKAEAISYLQETQNKLQQVCDQVDYELLEGKAAERIIEYARTKETRLIVLSSHGQSGLNEWNISSVVQKIVLQSQRSVLLIRAYHSMDVALEQVEYKKIALPLDCSQRAEFILPLASNVAKFYDATLLLVNIIRQPEIVCRTPASEKENNLVKELCNINQEHVEKYFSQLCSQLNHQGVDVQKEIRISKTLSRELHDLMEDQEVDLVMLTAHGMTGSHKWPYGNLATGFIIYGTKPLLILQDLDPEEIEESKAKSAAKEYRGH